MQLEEVIAEASERVLKGQEYAHARVAEWSARIAEQVLAAARAREPHRKLLVSVTITQRSAHGGGLHCSLACHWDAAHDGLCSYRWESAALVALTYVFAVAAD